MKTEILEYEVSNGFVDFQASVEFFACGTTFTAHCKFPVTQRLKATTVDSLGTQRVAKVYEIDFESIDTATKITLGDSVCFSLKAKIVNALNENLITD